MAEKRWRLIDFIWWPVETEDLAKRAIFTCLIFTCFYAFTWTTEVPIRIFSLSQHRYHFGEYLDIISLITFPITFLLMAWGLFKIKRIAAIAGFVIYLAFLIITLYHTITGSVLAKLEQRQLFQNVFLTFLYFHGIRGASSYKRLIGNKTVSTISEP